jgi:cytochrome oxidase assembly protein ShyY1
MFREDEDEPFHPEPPSSSKWAAWLAVGSVVALAAVVGLAWAGVTLWQRADERAKLEAEASARAEAEAADIAALREGRKANTPAEWRALLVGKGSHQLVAWFGPPDRILPRTAESDPGVWVYTKLKTASADAPAVGLTVEVLNGEVVRVR